MFKSLIAILGGNKTVEDGIKAYKEGNTELTWKIWTKLASKGDLDCLSLLGKLDPADGRIPPRPNGLFYWHGNVQNKPGNIHPSLFNNIGAMYANGLSIPVNYDLAYENFTLADITQDVLGRINLQKMKDDKCEISAEARETIDAYRSTNKEKPDA